MKMLSVLAVMAALIPTGVFAESGAPNQKTLQQRHSAVSTHSTVKHPSESAARAESPRRSRAEATAPREGARGANAFDGPWSVLINTRAGACDPSYRSGVEIINGQVRNAGGEPIAMSGRVSPSGAIEVTVSSGSQSAFGAGRLSRSVGSGTWRGQGSRGSCAGTWQAERRG